jgi:predicted amidophosphoribosyltransferase
MTEEQELEPKGLCSNCNRAVELDATVCPHCNASLSKSDLTPDLPGSQTHEI